ncbi:MAG: damage-inducible protein DinB [Zetaproteobacteria bacterium CG_4_10_14_0_2_um_filter_55_20]|nr:MAG: damage-inducible protein DinB [Zetaproteobacteria bacterium CG_4_10_14_0_8_um_filter_55_43]PIZ36634.1 MAG: damage-inducible protein DinB [Zetaproteobacteria bacterium CG_4_10_14_0_2_um_filter_55_20]
MIEYLQRMARYNRWMNRKLFEKTALLPAEAIRKNRHAFFASLLGTLNHIMVAELIWLRRFATHKDCKDVLASLSELPETKGLREILFKDFNDFTDVRERLDGLIVDFSQTLSDELLAAPIAYRNMAGEQHEHELGKLLQHFFNHQTHHRGQATTLLFQAGIDPGPTDLLVMLMEEG